jgi:3-oxoacyl-[acyl-carrier-protein] synthase II
MFALTRSPAAGAAVLAEILALDLRVCVDGNWRAAVTASVRQALDGAGCAAADVWAVSASGAAGSAGEAENAALEEVVASAVRLPALPELIGETHAVSAAFQLADVLVLAGSADRRPGRLGHLDRPTRRDGRRGPAAPG